MKSRLTLGRNMSAVLKAELQSHLFREAVSLDREIKLKITKSQPRGRTYRIGRITKAESKKLAGLGLKSYKTKSGKKRFIVGAKFYRASAKGQPPAIRTGGLLNANRIKAIGSLRYRVFNSKRYAVPLDAKDGLNRPFFVSTVKEFRPGYLRRLKGVLKKI